MYVTMYLQFYSKAIAKGSCVVSSAFLILLSLPLISDAGILTVLQLPVHVIVLAS